MTLVERFQQLSEIDRIQHTDIPGPKHKKLFKVAQGGTKRGMQWFAKNVMPERPSAKATFSNEKKTLFWIITRSAAGSEKNLKSLASKWKARLIPGGKWEGRVPESIMSRFFSTFRQDHVYSKHDPEAPWQYEWIFAKKFS